MKKTLNLPVIIAMITGFAIHSSGVDACTNILVSKNASVDGSTMITYAADSHVLYGELYFRPAQDHPQDAMLDIYEWDTGKYLGEIKQVPHTYKVIGNMNEPGRAPGAAGAAARRWSLRSPA